MKKFNILIVEDEALIAASLVHTLSSLGYTVQEPVATGDGAVHAVKTNRPDLILMDIQLLGAMNGIETAEKIRAIADIPVVYLTAYTDDLRLKQAQLTEPYGYIVKPAHSRELHATIEMALYKHTLDRKLKESELHYRELADSITDIFFAMDYDLRYTHWNKASENLTGIKSSDAIGRSISELFSDTPEIRKATEIYLDVLKNRKPRTFENQFITGDRSIFLEIQVYPSFEGISVFTKDITKRKLAEGELKASEARFRLLFNNQRDAVAVHKIGKDGQPTTFIHVNDVACERLGYTREEMLRLRPQDIDAPDRAGQMPAIIEKLLKDKQVLFETEHISKDGCRIPVEVSTVLFQLDDSLATMSVARDITERKLSEEALKKESRMRTALLDNIPGCIALILKKDTREIIASNKLAHEIGAVPGKTCFNTCAMRDDNCPFCLAPKLWQTGQTQKLEVEYRGIWYEGIWAPLSEDLFVHYIFDISERKRAEEALRESEERFLNAFEYAAIGMALISPDGRWLRVNQSTCEIVGYSENELQAMTFVDITHPDDLCTDLEYVRQMIAGEIHTYQMEKRYIHKSGELVWVLLSVSLVRDKQGKPLYFISQIENITGRKRAEEALHESARYTRNLIEVSLDPLVTISPEGKITDVNAATERVIGYSREYLIGTDFSNYFTDLEKAKEGYHKVFDDGVVRDYPLEIRHRDGKITSVLYNATIYNGESGTKQGVFAAARDITERKVAEEALLRANKKLNLLSSITRHDINNQLTVLMGYLAIINKKLPDPALNEYFQKVATAAQRISSMIKFTKEYQSIGVKAPAWQDCRTVVDTAAKEAPLGQIIVKNDLPVGTEVFADPLIVKVCYNLMDNAVRYGGKITTIRFFMDKREGDHIVVCEDDGDGVVAGEKEKIFERGFGKNTGLGLALAREILDITGITIRENGEPGKGARFEMVVPKGAYRLGTKQ